METTFYKYQGTGNDFVMIDNRAGFFPKDNHTLVAQICDRRFGIGADGLILLEDDVETHFNMVYYNADGYLGSMCGNGGRCIVAFARQLGIIENDATFLAADGLHDASIDEDGNVSLHMKDVDSVEIHPEYVFLDTGSPHHVQMENGLESLDVKSVGRHIRYGHPYGEKGTNVNFVRAERDGTFTIRTYERGVEDETLSCGTGVTATAIAMHATGRTQKEDIDVQVSGGQLNVSFTFHDGRYTNVFLTGPAQMVFNGELRW